MANTDNLQPVQSESEAREKGRNGGIASGEARRRKKTMREALEMLMYDVELDEGTTLPPEISYKLSGFGATSEVTKATSVPGTTEIKVKSGDGTQEKTYKFNFKVFETVLSDLKVGGTTIEGFDKNTYEYTYSLPYGWKASDGISPF